MSGPGSIRKTYNSDDAPWCEGYNCDCENPAKYQIQGETDSFGFETFDLCEECYQKMLSEGEDSKAKFLEENRDLAPEGKVWLSVADINDGSDWWYTYAQDKAEVLWERREADARYGSHGGLYRPSLELVELSRAKAVAESWQHRWEE